jgi:hypothetical protein
MSLGALIIVGVIKILACIVGFASGIAFGIWLRFRL